MRGLHEVVHEGRHPLAPGADLLPADELGGDVGHPQRAVGCEQRRRAAVVAHHHRVGELAAQRLDLDAVGDRLKVAHRFPPSAARTYRRVNTAWTVSALSIEIRPSPVPGEADAGPADANPGVR